MLNVFRENLRHLKWVLLLVVASFILTIFAVWGGGIGRDDSAGAGALWAARIDGQAISVQSFQREARNLETTYRQILGAQFEQQRSYLKVGQMAINSLVDRELLVREARKAGLRVSEQEVAQAIMREPSFQQNGAFIGKERYEKLFRANQLAIQEYERDVEIGLLVGKLRSLVEDSVTVSDAEVREAYARQNEKISVRYLLLGDDKLPAVAPADARIEEYYREHLADYPSGEGRTLRYVLFDAGDIAAGSDVPESEIRSQYLQDLKTRYTVPEKRRASHILIKLPPSSPPPDQLKAAEGKARATLERVRRGEDFAKVAREVSEDASASGGGDLNYFTREQMVREFSEAVWSLKVGQISDPVRSPFGFHVIRLTDIQPGREMTLEEARPQILSGLKAARGRAQAQRRAEDFVRRVHSARDAFEKVVKDSGMVPKEIQGFHRGDEFPELGPQPVLEDRLFALKQGEVSGAIPVPAGQAVVQFLSPSPGAPLPLSKVRDRVVRDLTEEARLQAARRRIEAAGGIGDLAALARRLNVELKNADPVARWGPLPELGGDADFMNRLFALKAGETLGPVATPSGIAVIRVLSHSNPMEGFDSQTQTLRNGLLASKRDRLFRAFLERLRAANRVEINTVLIDQVDRT